MKKRDFLRLSTLGALSTGLPYPRIFRLMDTVKTKWAGDLASDEDFWKEIRKGYDLKNDYINLENGYYCMMPIEIRDRYIEKLKYVNREASYYMRTVQFENQKRIADKLAETAGCAPGQLIITRNTTESMDLVISGQNWQKGDEAVMSDQDYGAMLNQFEMMAERYGIENVVVQMPNHPSSDQEIVDLYAEAITEKTKLLMICHMINITGQVLPVRQICDMAHERGVKVLVDGAHAFAHLDFQIQELNCDFYATSLHKWLSVPLGAGFLYVNPKHIDDVWPLFAEGSRDPGDISRLNHTGTHPVHTHLAIEDALDFHERLGIERKQARLKYLNTYWTSKVRGLDRVILNTPAEETRYGAIANVGIEGISPSDLARTLLDKYGIWTVAINHPNVKGVRVTPNIYTTTGELDQFVAAIKELATL